MRFLLCELCVWQAKNQFYFGSKKKKNEKKDELLFSFGITPKMPTNSKQNYALGNHFIYISSSNFFSETVGIEENANVNTQTEMISQNTTWKIMELECYGTMSNKRLKSIHLIKFPFDSLSLLHRLHSFC